jgi:selenide, water dikinase
LADTIRLTTNAKAAGCAAKLSPSMLDAVLKKLPAQRNPNVLVGFETSDDAAVYQLTDDLAIVQTVDFFTPIVDDPALFGQVAATNSLSDVYAMGGVPISALTILAYPAAGAPEVLEQILRGGLSKMVEANCTVVGGHSIRDDEIKFGYAVTGTIHPERVWKNVGARPGDVLILTKPIGTGVISTALKQERAEPAWVASATTSMTRLNRDAAKALHEIESSAPDDEQPIHAVTDVTGFGLLGHGLEMARGSGTRFVFVAASLPELDGALELARAGVETGGGGHNRRFVARAFDLDAAVPAELVTLAHDAQTSGGLLAAIDPSKVAVVEAELTAAGVPSWQIGRVEAVGEGREGREPGVALVP